MRYSAGFLGRENIVKLEPSNVNNCKSKDRQLPPPSLLSAPATIASSIKANVRLGLPFPAFSLRVNLPEHRQAAAISIKRFAQSGQLEIDGNREEEKGEPF